MVQSFNLAGILNTFRVLANPSLAMPHIIINDLRELPIAELKKNGIKAIAFDKDNCLTAPYVQEIHPPFKETWQICKDTFKVNNMAIVSNSAGTLDDKDGKEAEALEKALGIHVLRHTEKKPSGGKALTNHFKALPNEISFVGDRVLTDVVYGNLNGYLTIWTKQVITEKGDNKAAILIRRFEHQFIKILHHLDVQPRPHPFFSSNNQNEVLQ
ncbi:unnamed protein product [Cunninghamella blakesleeana]